MQTGDILDRGDGSRRSLDLLMRLEKEAEPAGQKPPTSAPDELPKKKKMKPKNSGKKKPATKP